MKLGASALDVGLALAVVASLLSPRMASGAEALTTQQMTALPPAAANRTVRDDLLSILKPTDHISRFNRRRLGDIPIETHPYGTRFNGLCQRDVLDLKYAPTDTSAKFEDQPVQPYGVEVQSEFHAVRLPTPGTEGLLAVWSQECDRLDGNDKVLWFSAADAEAAVKALNLLKAATDQLRAGTLKPDKCDLSPVSGQSCAQTILSESDITTVDDVRACPATATMECYEIDLGRGMELSIVGRLGSDGLAPVEVKSISAGVFVVVT